MPVLPVRQKFLHLQKFGFTALHKLSQFSAFSACSAEKREERQKSPNPYRKHCGKEALRRAANALGSLDAMAATACTCHPLS
jgi:hypothetical protein